MRQKLDHVKQSQEDTIKTSSKRVLQKTAGATDDLLAIKFLINLQNFQKINNKII